MIPKQLFFVWLGNGFPLYFSNVLKNYKEVNPSFNINLININISDLENISFVKSNKLLYESFINLVNNEYYYNLANKKTFVLSLSMIYKKKILNTYGGIYLDLDTFPIKPFDDKLLSKEKFNCMNSFSDNAFINQDSFFFGNRRLEDEKDSGGKMEFLFPLYNIPETSFLKEKFYNGMLKYGDYYNTPKHHYIDHYRTNSYLNLNNTKCNLCVYDSFIKEPISKGRTKVLEYLEDL